MMLKIGRTPFGVRILNTYDLLEYAIRIPGLPDPVWLRPGETDQAVFEQIFGQQHYAPRRPVPVRTIVDAGANVGYSVLWFALRYPGARILAIEPDPANFALLARNCAGLPGVELVHGALWHEEGQVALVTEAEGRPLRSWGTRTVAAAADAAAAVPCFTLDGLADRHGLERIDYLKLDIEGAEREVLEAPGRRWLERTGLVALETHDRFRPGCDAAMEAVLGPRARERYRKGENWFFHLDPAPDPAPPMAPPAGLG